MHDIYRLRVLIELRKRGTMTAVAEALSYSTSAVSQQITQLEKYFNVPLIIPDGKYVKLTNQAEILIEYAEEILVLVEQAKTEMQTSADLKGELSVASLGTAAEAFFTDIVREVQQENKNIHILYSYANPKYAINSLLAREFDAVVIEHFQKSIFSKDVSRNLLVDTFYSDEMLLAMPKEADPNYVLANLQEYEWVLELRDSPAYDWSVSVLKSLGLSTENRYEFSDISLQTKLVEAGLALAFFPSLIPEYLRDKVQVVPLSKVDSTLGKELTHRKISFCTRTALANHPLISDLRGKLPRNIESE